MWKEIKGYNGDYLINEKGEVFSNKTNMVLKGGITKGYRYVILCNEGKQRSPKVHRLVAEQFLDNPNNYPCVNHIDGNPSNNNVENLEWCTYSHNTKHAYKMKLQEPLTGEKNPMYGKRGRLNGKSRTVLMLNENNEIEKEFESMELAVDFLKENGHPKANSSSISLCCKGGKYKSAYKKKWRYKL